VRAGCGLAARRTASDRAQSVRGGRGCAHTFKLSTCRSAASPQVDPVGSALLRRPQRGVSAMTVDGRGTRRGWTVHGHDACSKRRALTYLSWPTSATAIRLEWLSGALSRARTCTELSEPLRLGNLAQRPQQGVTVVLVRGRRRAHAAGVSEASGRMAHHYSFAIEQATGSKLKCSSAFVQIRKSG
jgi:hypothetical protein